MDQTCLWWGILPRPTWFRLAKQRGQRAHSWLLGKPWANFTYPACGQAALHLMYLHSTEQRPLSPWGLGRCHDVPHNMINMLLGTFQFRRSPSMRRTMLQSTFIARHKGCELCDLVTSVGSWDMLEGDLIVLIQTRARVWPRRESLNLMHSVPECLSSFPGLYLVGICRCVLHLPPSRGRPQSPDIGSARSDSQAHPQPPWEDLHVSHPSQFEDWGGGGLRDGLGVSGPGGRADCSCSRAERTLPVPSWA